MSLLNIPKGGYTERRNVIHTKRKYLMYILINYFRPRLTNDRPDLSSERAAPQRQDSNFHKATFRQEVISGDRSQSGLDTTVY
jgi:hypothetical protein